MSSHAMSNVAHAVWEHARSHPDRVALRAPAAQWSYQGLWERAAAVAGHIRASGFTGGDRVLLVAPSVPEFVCAYLGLLSAGAVVVTSNTMSTQRELDYVVGDAGCVLIVAWHESSAAASAVAAARGIPVHVLAPGARNFGCGRPVDRPLETAAEHTAVILYTSGTTGQPKGAQLTHANLVACAEVFAAVLELTPRDRVGTALPLFHVFGQAVIMGSALHAGGSLSLLARFDAAEMLGMLRRDRLTVLAGVPTMWNAMLQVAGDYDAADFAGLRLAASGGAALPAEVMRAFRERFGCVVLEGYGLTETTGAATFNGLHRARKIGSAGIALPGVEVTIRDEDGRELPPLQVGEICVRGPVVMAGYWRRAEETGHVLHGGLLRTGDLGTTDAEGDLRIVDRKKDLIVHGGYNVYPREVEEVLYEHPDIVEAAVIGVPDAHYGEQVAAVLVLRHGAAVTAEQLRRWTKQRLSAYKAPALYQFVSELPKGPTGKLLKRGIDIADVMTSAQGRHRHPVQGCAETTDR